GGKNICPVGWHVPTDAEWTTLTDYLGGLSVAGGKLTEAGTIHWTYDYAVATNSSSFTALPGGHRKSDGWGFNYIGLEGYWWTSSANSGDGVCRRLTHYSNSAETSDAPNSFGFSVRCVKD
ncbi:MAG: hypothetical protein HGA52_00370, partial [Bacteroidales bacterium]|nr:hypothetical protein [Bacteroidales bacterium]